MSKVLDETRPVDSLKELVLNTMTGRIAICLTFGLFLYTGFSAADKYVGLNIQQNNVGWGPEAEIYVERDNKKYFSHIDGREISDVVKE